MGQIHLAFVWHQHQPYYRNLVNGECLMPWVRLHGIREYIGMASLMREVPEQRQTINLVPSLIVQIEDYLNGASDSFLDHTRIPAADLAEEQIKYILGHFFMANWENMVNVHPRYAELLEKRSPGRKSVDRVWKRFSKEELRDLQVWANLAWVHPTVLETDQTLAGLVAKDRDFSEDDKAVVLDKQMESLGQIIPQHKQLQDSGQLEVSTTPFYHPILPLLWDISLAHVALPQMAIPQVRADFRADVDVHVNRAVECYRERFGCAPQGMWPAEGSVAPQIIPALAKAGLKWIATDEEILGLSIGTFFDRNEAYDVLAPDKLYTPYNISADGASISAIFRDHHLSDLIGFKYQWIPAEAAVRDFISRLDRIRTAHPNKDHLVSVVLDGENPWDTYANNGVDFIRALYRELASQPWITTVRVADHLAEHPATEQVDKLFAGSWISHNFSTWVGHREKNTGWEYLDRTRAFLEQEDASRKGSGEEVPQRAWEELYIAEGSDWFWWYGDDHFSGNDEEFDRLFREHLKNVYRLAGAEPPGFLDNAIVQTERMAVYTNPKTFLSIKLDGRPTTYFEWASAGRYDHSRDAGTMQRVSGMVLDDIYFGFDEKCLHLRFDLHCPDAPETPEPARKPARMFIPGARTAARPKKQSVTDADAKALWHGLDITVAFRGAVEAELKLTKLATSDQKMTLQLPPGNGDEIPLNSFALKQILEASIPFQDLGVEPGAELEFAVEVARDGATVQRAPENSSISLKVPTSDFERVMWQV